MACRIAVAQAHKAQPHSLIAAAHAAHFCAQCTRSTEASRADATTISRSDTAASAKLRIHCQQIQNSCTHRRSVTHGRHRMRGCGCPRPQSAACPGAALAPSPSTAVCRAARAPEETLHNSPPGPSNLAAHHRAPNLSNVCECRNNPFCFPQGHGKYLQY